MNPAGKTLFAQQKMNSFNLWEIRNGGGGWVHPFHLHMEEHKFSAALILKSASFRLAI